MEETRKGKGSLKDRVQFFQQVWSGNSPTKSEPPGFLSSTPSPTSRSPSTEQQVFSPTSPTSSRSVSTESLHSLTTTTTTRYTSKVQVDIHIRQLKD
ncbi:hypothetical protein O3M35_007268 [Rhynocoris fuscipes]|uniref:Uncharacterized protein n=1 Tax=Rhynocoris fuscipes TaxID=488301 RepID=A0AAW1DAD2_9HEMI